MLVHVRWMVLAWVAFAALGPVTSVQLAGWAGMLVRDAATRPWSQAVQRTFDGQHPCCMCKTVNALRDENAARGGMPGPDLRAMRVDLALGALVCWTAPKPSACEDLPGWSSVRLPDDVDADPDDPVPRFRV
jgi:hypothetical protein